MKIKARMIGLDMDGTLLTTEKELTAYTRRVLEEAISRGIVVLPATGRPACALPAQIKLVSGIRYAVTSNGARVIDIRENRAIFQHLIPKGIGRKILEILEQYDTLREVYYDGIGYSQEDKLKNISKYVESPFMADYIKSTRTPVPDVRAKFEEERRALDKIQGIFADMQEMSAAAEKLREIPEIEATGSIRNNIEVNAKGVNKGDALIELGEMLGISRSEIMAFGDGRNDLEMLKRVGIGVAMANGTKEVREAADYVTESNDEEGVARFIEAYVLN